MALTIRTVKVTDCREEYDAFWALFFRGQVVHSDWSASLVGDSMPDVLFPDANKVRLRWSSGGVRARRGVVSLRADEVDLSDERIRQLTQTGTVDLFSTAMGRFVLNFGAGDARPRIQKTENSIRVDWPNALPRVDVPWWPIDPVIDYVDAFANRLVRVKTTLGLSLQLEFV